MKLHVYRRNGKFIGSFVVDDDITVERFSALFYKNYHYYPERQRFHIGSATGKLLEPEGTLRSQKIEDETDLYFKDLGVQISWRLVFVIEYLGPLLFLPLFWCFPQFFYRPSHVFQLHRSPEQRILTILMAAHFVKRELESLFVHRFSHVTMPIMRLPINCFHYWVLCGISVGYFLCHPLYSSPWGGGGGIRAAAVRPSSSSSVSFAFCVLAALFLLFEGLNGICHIILRNLRPRGTRRKGIPEGCGFGLVSCANYTYETCAWVTFSIMAGMFTCWIFTVVAFGQMAIWALRKHAIYKKTFPSYPKIRKAIVPFVL